MREEIIKMAREAIDQSPREDWNSTAWVLGDEALERFFNMAQAAERTVCEQICDDLWQEDGTAYDCREAIRARGQE